MLVYLIGAIMKVVGFYEAWIPTLAGAALLAFTRIYQRIKFASKSSKPSRLPAIMLFSSGLMIYSAYLMYNLKGYWVLPILIVAVLEFYISYRIPKE